MTKDHYLNEVYNGSLYVGSAETVAKKIAYALQSVGANRFDLKYSTGPMPHPKLMTSIELLGTEVVPMVKQILAESLASK